MSEDGSVCQTRIPQEGSKRERTEDIETCKGDKRGSIADTTHRENNKKMAEDKRIKLIECWKRLLSGAGLSDKEIKTIEKVTFKDITFEDTALLFNTLKESLDILEIDHYPLGTLWHQEFNDPVKEDKARKKSIYNIDYNKTKERAMYALAGKLRGESTEEVVAFLNQYYKFYSIKNSVAPEIWYYEEGIYKPNGISLIKEICRKMYGQAHTNSLSSSVVAKIEADNFIESTNFFNQADLNLDYVPLQNGIYNLKTLELEPHSQDKIFFSKLPVFFDKKAYCPNIIQHFETVLKDKSDVKTFQELFGYLLLRENRFEVAVMMNGCGRNGKTKTLELIKTFVGCENSCSITLEQLENDQYSMGNLLGKMVNLAGDLNKTALKNTGNLKNCIGRDQITANRKNQTHISFVPYAKMFFACNELPITFDTTEGFWSKWLFFDFPYTFVTETEYSKIPEEEKQKYRIKDENIVKTLTTQYELSGLFNWAVVGLHRLLKQKRFSASKTSQEIKSIWIARSDSLKAFCLEHIAEDYDSFITKKEFRYQYAVFCRQKKVNGTSDKYIKALLAEDFGAVEGRPLVNGERELVWQGIRFKKLLQGSSECQGCQTYQGYLPSPGNFKFPIAGKTPDIPDTPDIMPFDYRAQAWHSCCYPVGNSPCGEAPSNEFEGLWYCEKHFITAQKEKSEERVR